MPSDVDEIEYPVPAHPADDDLAYAPKAVVVHLGLGWPTGTVYAGCHAWPCALNRWGRTVLAPVGYVEEDVAGLIRRAKDRIVPWS
ncbi:hypothetical protein ACNTMW_06345 [Planosporangium sp. 12N6]|uniref:hypothetical protein n=1 Tax=Planosporangium spinosum TaxID=3402278 RepID=UPI003CF43CCB